MTTAVGIGDAVRSLIAERLQALDRVAYIDAELAEIRAALEPRERSAATMTAVPPVPAEDGIRRACSVCGSPFTQRSPRQLACGKCSAAAGHSKLPASPLLDPKCADCGEPFRRKGRPANIPRCVECTAKHTTQAPRRVIPPAPREEFETVWNGGEGLSSGGGCALADLR